MCVCRGGNHRRVCKECGTRHDAQSPAAAGGWAPGGLVRGGPGALWMQRRNHFRPELSEELMGRFRTWSLPGILRKLRVLPTVTMTGRGRTRRRRRCPGGGQAARPPSAAFLGDELAGRTGRAASSRERVLGRPGDILLEGLTFLFFKEENISQGISGASASDHAQ